MVCACLLLAACGKQQQSKQAAEPAGAAIRIERLDPSYTAQGKAFNVQPDGQAALAVVGSDIPLGSVVLWNDQPLKTSGGGSQGWVGAAVPANLYATPGTARVAARSPDGTTVSNALEFTIYARTGPAPEISELYPVSAVGGKGFNLQPGGNSALGVSGTSFLPGCKVFFGGKEMKTTLARGTYISAAIPRALATQAGEREVWVVNPDGKTSKKVVFNISKE